MCGTAKIHWLILFREICLTVVYTKSINKLGGRNTELVNVKVGGTYGYHCAMKG
jgi:hypothetical protein